MKSLYTIKEFIQLINKWLLLFFIVTLFSIFIIDFWLINIPEKFAHGYQLGRLWREFSFSFVSAFIFYLIVVVSKEFKERRITRQLLFHALNEITNEQYQFLNFLYNNTSANIKRTKIGLPKESEIRIICKGIDPKESTIPLDLNRTVNWFYYIRHIGSKTKNITSSLLLQIKNPEPTLSVLLSDIDNCSLFKAAEAYSQAPNAFHNLEVLTKDINRYFIAISRLYNYVTTF
ncbi:hypothetical protein KEM09_03940 [Carboxylicivirga mesophila]|uniref:Uncharacterized protein n=1 Tax=Carboxylicivirga mesophila TaxID=1166478 RepID=A0ABS5K6F6_9BACT|nr:hypothetical protein [Carboxylicivirga mesophila]MBS2210536.1 hypothetical protein [Carboxylicivirga mesophila]